MDGNTGLSYVLARLVALTRSVLGPVDADVRLTVSRKRSVFRLLFPHVSAPRHT